MKNPWAEHATYTRLIFYHFSLHFHHYKGLHLFCRCAALIWKLCWLVLVAHKSNKLLTANPLPSLKETYLAERSPQSSHMCHRYGDQLWEDAPYYIYGCRLLCKWWRCGVIIILVWCWEPTTVTRGPSLHASIYANQFRWVNMEQAWNFDWYW